MGAAQLSHKLAEKDFPYSGILLPMRGRPPKKPDRQLPNRLREWRNARQLTIQQMAELMQSNYQTVARHETGDNDMTLARLERYAEVLDVKVEELLNDSQRVPMELRELIELAQNLSREDQKRLLRLGASLQEPDSPIELRPTGTR